MFRRDGPLPGLSATPVRPEVEDRRCGDRLRVGAVVTEVTIWQSRSSSLGRPAKAIRRPSGDQAGFDARPVPMPLCVTKLIDSRHACGLAQSAATVARSREVPSGCPHRTSGRPRDRPSGQGGWRDVGELRVQPPGGEPSDIGPVGLHSEHGGRAVPDSDPAEHDERVPWRKPGVELLVDAVLALGREPASREPSVLAE